MKQSKTISEQIELLKVRGLLFNDEPTAQVLLAQNNYYRLSGYWRKYQIDPDNKDDGFMAGTIFDDVLYIYKLDAELRNLLQKGLSAFEICFRSIFAHYMAQSKPAGQFLYLNQNSYSDKTSQHEGINDLLDSIKSELQRSNEKYVSHYKKIKENIPIWVAVEVLSFSTISKMYSRWIDKDVVKKVCQELKLSKNYCEAIQVVRALVYLRNLCAHQARIWNREMIVKVANKNYLQQFGASKERAPWRIISILMSQVDKMYQNDNYSKALLNLCSQNNEFRKGLFEPTL